MLAENQVVALYSQSLVSVSGTQDNADYKITTSTTQSKGRMKTLVWKWVFKENLREE